MDFLTELWAPIVLSAVIAWIVSAIIWTVAPHRKAEWSGVTDEERFLGTIRSMSLGAGYYMFPFCGDAAQMKDEAFKKRWNEGPIGVLHVWSHRRSMGACMIGSFVFNLVASVFIAYIAWNSLDGRAGLDYLKVFQITGATAFMAYSFALIPGGIWFGKPIRSMVYDVVEGLVIGLLTGGVFGWLWAYAAGAVDAAAGAAAPG